MTMWQRMTAGARPRLLGLGLVLGLLSPVAGAGPLVVLDVGHSKTRPGSISASGTPEFDYNLRLAAAVSHELAGHGIEVITSGAEEYHVPLAERTAETRDAALFVSLHHDSIQQLFIDEGLSEHYWGFSVFVSQKNRHWAKSVKCASAVGQQMLFAGEVPSLFHAMEIKGENRPFVDRERGVHRYDDLVVLKRSLSPAILVEAGVIANPKEDKRLALDKTARRLGQAIAEGIAQCL